MKGFFRNFTGAVYNFDTENYRSQRVVTDITRSIQFKDIGNIVRYDKYYISDGETPDNVAYKLYGDSTKHWILYLLNPFLKNGWPLSDRELDRAIQEKYGSSSFLVLADESVYNIDFSTADSVSFHLESDSPALNLTLKYFDHTRSALIITQLLDYSGLQQSEWMKNLDMIYIKIVRGSNTTTYSLAVDSSKSYYLMKNAAYSYSNKTYRDALYNDGVQTALSFEQYEINKNENKKYIRVLNSSDAERVSQQYFQILKDG